MKPAETNISILKKEEKVSIAKDGAPPNEMNAPVLFPKEKTTKQKVINNPNNEIIGSNFFSLLKIKS
jgi:hypothetical protein